MNRRTFACAALATAAIALAPATTLPQPHSRIEDARLIDYAGGRCFVLLRNDGLVAAQPAPLRHWNVSYCEFEAAFLDMPKVQDKFDREQFSRFAEDVKLYLDGYYV